MAFTTLLLTYSAMVHQELRPNEFILEKLNQLKMNIIRSPYLNLFSMKRPALIGSASDEKEDYKTN